VVRVSELGHSDDSLEMRSQPECSRLLAVAPQSEEIIVADMARSPSRTSKRFCGVAGTKNFRSRWESSRQQSYMETARRSRTSPPPGRPVPSMRLPFHSAPAFRTGILFTSFLGIETSCRILRTSLLCRPDAPRFEKTAHRCSQEAFRNEQSFRLRHPLALSIVCCYLLPSWR
jgi:hypothetical protein